MCGVSEYRKKLGGLRCKHTMAIITTISYHQEKGPLKKPAGWEVDGLS